MDLGQALRWTKSLKDRSILLRVTFSLSTQRKIMTLLKGNILLISKDKHVTKVILGINYNLSINYFLWEILYFFLSILYLLALRLHLRFIPNCLYPEGKDTRVLVQMFTFFLIFEVVNIDVHAGFLKRYLYTCQNGLYKCRGKD